MLLETVHRFKGRAADAVVLVGDIENLDDEGQRRRAFVGLTRARLSMSVVC
jgi:superfamily I DNA/RNA helicase